MTKELLDEVYRSAFSCSTCNEAKRIQVLALTHENATAEERMPYLSWLFYPIPVFNLVGRSANMHPPCKKNECVWYAWKD